MYSHVFMLALLMKWFNFSLYKNLISKFFLFTRVCKFFEISLFIGNPKSSELSLDLP